MNSIQLLVELVDLTNRNISAAETFRKLSTEKLNFRQSAEKWNILECLDHLNQYSDYYLQEISKAIDNSKNDFQENFSPGILGNYFAQSMLPKKGMKKLKSPKNKLPISRNLDISIIDKFIENQKLTLAVVEKCKHKNLNKNRVKTSISILVRLKLGDILRFLVYHNLRHILQAEKILRLPLKKDA